MSEKIYTLSICLLMVTISFSALIGLTLVFSVSGNVYVALILLLFTLIAPLLAYIHHSKTYFVVLPACYLGSWFISMTFFTSLSIPFMYSIYLISAVPATVVTVMHIFSRERNMLLGRVPLSSLAKTGFAEASLIFLVVGLSILGLGTVKLDPFNKVAFLQPAIGYVLFFQSYVCKLCISIPAYLQDVEYQQNRGKNQRHMGKVNAKIFV